MNSLIAFMKEAYPPRAKYGVELIPDLSGQVFLITGGNAGIGKETAKHLLSHNAKVYIAARSREKTDKAIAELKDATGKEAIFIQLDLADLKSVKAAAHEFLRQETRLNVLYNNGGVMFAPAKETTPDGYDLQWGTNVVGHFYLTQLLIPILLETAKSTGVKARVVTAASSGHLFTSKFAFDSFKAGPVRDKMSTKELYFQSKAGNLIFANELARRYGDRGIVSIALNPGNIKTELQRHMGFFELTIGSTILYDVAHGALTGLFAGTAPEGADLNGKYLIPWARLGTPTELVQDPKLALKIWSWLEEQTQDI
ncbi:hypothetical protein PLICRDRAFT_103635 [Plicaturopsis crispa FD-325 SS-3]|nr:hypothetical protein PLICRDRAFT_103635 [Plicaturopsis crispa FD-325 SS-3]